MSVFYILVTVINVLTCYGAITVWFSAIDFATVFVCVICIIKLLMAFSSIVFTIKKNKKYVFLQIICILVFLLNILFRNDIVYFLETIFMPIGPGGLLPKGINGI